MVEGSSMHGAHLESMLLTKVAALAVSPWRGWRGSRNRYAQPQTSWCGMLYTSLDSWQSLHGVRCLKAQVECPVHVCAASVCADVLKSTDDVTSAAGCCAASIRAH